MPGRTALLDQLRRHVPFDEREERMVDRFVGFVQAHPECFERSLAAGHVTGSAWVLDPSRTRTLLTHHAKLNRWMQMGGHADGDPDILTVSLREAREESGLTSLKPIHPEIFDVDIHEIPVRGSEAAHFHYDARYLFQADPREPLVISNESHELRWVPLQDVPHLTPDESVLRLVARTACILPGSGSC